MGAQNVGQKRAMYLRVFHQKSKHFWVVLAAQFQEKLFWTKAEVALIASTYFHSALNSFMHKGEGKSNLTAPLWISPLPSAVGFDMTAQCP